ncbi:MAG: transposase [Proteobacteria bacterium]|nr:transposase [Pseudomonadota bacterium]
MRHPRKSKRLRHGRFSGPGHIYLVTICCEQRKPVFRNIDLGRIVIDQFEHSDRSGGTATFAFVVMPDHLHWLVALANNKTLETVVGHFKGRAARQINLMRGKTGKLWQPGFHDHALRHEEGVQSAGNCVIYNPVRAGLAKTLEDYRLWGATWIDGSGWPRIRP